MAQRRRNTVHPDTTLTWRVTSQSVVESHSARDGLAMLERLSSFGDDDSAPTMTILEASRALSFAALDPNIVRLVVDMSTDGQASGGGMNSPDPLSAAQVQEIRQAVLDFKQWKDATLGPGNCETVLVTDTFGHQLDYYFASAFDEVHMQPTGYIPFSGMSRNLPFFKNALERLGIDVYVETREEFKSFPSVFNHTQLPPPQRANTEALLASLNDIIKRDIQATRGRTMEERAALGQGQALAEITKLSNEGIIFAPTAVSKGMVDKLGYYPDIVNADKYPKRMDLAHYFGCNKLSPANSGLKATSRVGVVYLRGAIERSNGEFSPRKVARAIREAADADDIDAIVFRVDSGGGDPIGSDTIAQAVDYARTIKKKPVIASYAGSAASGAYLATAQCDYIFAQPLTVTGSIGVAMTKVTIQDKFLDRLGITVDTYTSGSTIDSPLHALSAEDKDRYKRIADFIYDDFLQRVQTGRQFTSEYLKTVAGGRVFTGLQAHQNGLVDGLGGILDAVGFAVLTARAREDPGSGDSPSPNQQVINRVRASLAKGYVPPNASAEADTDDSLSTEGPGASKDSDSASSTDSDHSSTSGKAAQSAIHPAKFFSTRLVTPTTEIEIFPRTKSFSERFWGCSSTSEQLELVTQYLQFQMAHAATNAINGLMSQLGQAVQAETGITTMSTQPQVTAAMDTRVRR
ncbi:peptidase family S49-domain-containing protein [Dimargaris cristalligena]|uniref:Peptidase family S49-domain-containing protein n=1 Tax=Dimargaris cristalligena TaxID=215637 RepID=A0A4P9ZLY9_9FUNG|nr:peptidase family S49-domain-containing protein [Dimargaris cristalligena]|eukprot:RKP34183.1 peptidase family S49-domain-containing protein [Dimargaris cristalligena]